MPQSERVIQKNENSPTTAVQSVNRRLVLDYVRRWGAVSRGEVALGTGISLPTVGKIVDWLAERQLVRQVGATTGVGRPAPLLAVSGGHRFSLCFSYEGTFLAQGLVDLQGRVIHQSKTRYDMAPRAFMEMLCQDSRLIEAAMAEAGCDKSGFTGIGVALPGGFSPSKGQYTLQASDGKTEPLPTADYASALSSRFKVPVLFESCANAACLGEYERTMWPRGQDLVYLWIGTGVGAALILDGRLRHGTHGLSGSLSHCPDTTEASVRGKIQPSLAQRVSFPVLEQQFALERYHGRGQIPTAMLGRIAEHTAAQLAPVLAGIASFLDCEAVVLGGEVPELLESVLPGALEAHLAAVGRPPVQARMQCSADNALAGLGKMVSESYLETILAG